MWPVNMSVTKTFHIALVSIYYLVSICIEQVFRKQVILLQGRKNESQTDKTITSSKFLSKLETFIN